MQPELLKPLPSPNHSFSVRKDIVPYFYNRWHFHTEIELIHIIQGNGTQFLGDSISKFKFGDLIMVGSNLPHFWKCDEQYFQNNDKVFSIATVAHFKENFWGNDFLNLPENIKIKELFEKAKRGLYIKGSTKEMVIEMMEKMLIASEAERIITLLEILLEIAKNKNFSVISSIGFTPNINANETERINTIYNYSLKKFKEKISIEEISGVANISPNSFCRFFKLHTRKTYNTFLQELRVGYASKLLIENKRSITQICYDSGFNNITNFYKSFKKIMNETPSGYQKKFTSE